MLPKWGDPTNRKINWSASNTQPTKTKWGFSTSKNTTQQPTFLKSNITKFKPIINDKSMQQEIYLLSKTSSFDFFKCMPLSYTISTKNSEAKFNTSILLDSSTTISQAFKENPTNLQYHLDIDDDKNVLGKFQLLFQGENVNLDANELLIARKITNELNITCCPTFLKMKNYGISYIKPFLSTNNMLMANMRNELIVNVQKKNFCTFTIETKAKKYKCNIIGVLSSTVIRDFMTKNPTKDSYFYDYDDTKKEFQTICNIFNFEKVVLSNNNVFILKDICDDLKIDCLSRPIESYIDLKEAVSRLIDDQQNTIDTIDDLFDLLYHIKEKKVENVAMLIDQSEWSKTEENVIELAAFIIQVIESSYQVHPYIIDLLIKLNENQSSNLKILLPFISKHLLKSFKEKIKNTKCDLIFPFVYQMMKKELISKNEINTILRYDGNRNIIGKDGNIKVDYFNKVWFIPELLENKHEVKIISKYYPYTDHNVELFKEKRDKGEYDDEIATTLRNDDIDKFQSYITMNVQKLIKEKIKINMFEPFFDTDIRYLNYAAAYGSIKCFKYLLLNNENINYQTFYMAIIGGNNELIRLVDNTISKLDVNQKILINSLIHTIKMHQNNLFDWLLEQKLPLINTDDNLESLFMCSIENGNPHAMIQIIDNGFDFNKNTSKYINFLETASKKGFYLLDNLLVNLIKKPNVKQLNLNIDPLSTVFFGNVSIFKLFIPNIYNSAFKQAILYAINEKYISIIHYFYDDVIKSKKNVSNSNDSIQILSAALKNQSYDIFQYIFNIISTLYTIEINNLIELLNNALISNNFEASKILSENIHKLKPRQDFTNPCFLAIRSKLNGIVELYINEKYQLNLNELSERTFDLGATNVEIFTLIYNNSDSSCQNAMKKCINRAIEKVNKPLIQFLLDKDSLLDDSLFEAARTNSLELIEMILEKKSDPVYINRIVKHSNPLIVAAEQKNIPILKKLISMPGINPSAYGASFETPLTISCRNFCSEIFSEILEFYGENIKNEKWQLYKAISNIFSTKFPSDPKSQEAIKFILNKIIDLNLIDLNYGSNDFTILIYACANNLTDIVKKLIQIDYLNVNAYSPKTIQTPLLISIEKRNEEISTILINCSKTDLNIKNDDGKTALICAIELNQVKIVDLIINSDRFNIKENNIDYALTISSPNIAEKLLRLNIYKSIDFNIKPPSYLNNYIDIILNKNLPNKVIIKAIKGYNSSFLDFIIDNKYFCISNESAIIYMLICIIENNQYFFNKLIAKYIDCDINMLFSNTKISLLTLACQKNSSDEIISSILNHSTFDSSKSNIVRAFQDSFINYQSSISDLLWDYDCKHDHLIESYLNNNLIAFLDSIMIYDLETKVNFVIDHGIDLNKPDISGDYCLGHAIYTRNEPLSLALIKSEKIDLKKKIPIKNTESEYTSYLHIAIEYKMENVASVLISDKSFDINITDSIGETPLMCACRNRSLDCINNLFERNDLDYQHKNNNNEDCLKIIKKSIPYIQNDEEEEYDDEKCCDKSTYLSKIEELINETYPIEMKYTDIFAIKQKNKDRDVVEKRDQPDSDSQKISIKTKKEEENKIKEEQDKNQSDSNNQEISTKTKQENENKNKEEQNELNSLSNSSNQEISTKTKQENENDNENKKEQNHVNSISSSNNQEISIKTKQENENENKEEPNQQNSISNSNNQEKSLKEINQTIFALTPDSKLNFSQSKSTEKTKASFDTYNESFSEKPDSNFLNLINELKQKKQHDSQNQKLIINESLQQIKMKPGKHYDLDKIQHNSDSQFHLRKRKDITIADSFYNEDVNYNYNQYQYQLQQEQQLQWFQMIQANNALQVQMNIQMLNQFQVNQKIKKKHGKKSKK